VLELAVDDVQVGPADRAGPNPQQHLSRPRHRVGQLALDERPARRLEHHRAHGDEHATARDTPSVRIVVLVALAVAISSQAAQARPETLIGFRMPSRNMACAIEPALPGARGVLRCDVLSGLKPRPHRACELDWTGLSMGVTGRATPTCAGDTVADPRMPILRYGRSWHRGAFTCTSRRTGVTCRNRAGHGFVLARERWRSF
jgi:hypothetical protein